MILLSDIVWTRVAFSSFLKKKSVFFMTLLLFILSQSILEQHQGDDKDTAIRVLIFVCRASIYLFSLSVQLVYVHGKKCFNAFKAANYVKVMGVVPVPNYLFSWQEAAGFALMLCLVSMLILEPILWCIGETDDIFDTTCDAASGVEFTYSVFSMVAVFLYYALLIDLTVVSTKVSAYVLVGIRLISEVCSRRQTRDVPNHNHSDHHNNDRLNLQSKLFRQTSDTTNEEDRIPHLPDCDPYVRSLATDKWIEEITPQHGELHCSGQRNPMCHLSVF